MGEKKQPILSIKVYYFIAMQLLTCDTDMAKYCCIRIEEVFCFSGYKN